MILKNKRSRETLNITLSDFKTSFNKELKTALESYIRSEKDKLYYKIKKTYESDFYLNLQWNFNHLACTDWYIEQL